MGRLLRVLFTLVGIVVIAAFVIVCIFWAKIPSEISSKMSKKMGVTVKLDSVSASPNRLSLNKLFIGNLPKSILTTAFSAKTIDVNAPLTAYTSKNIVIEEIDLTDIYLGLEFDSPSGTTGNWTRLMSNLENSSASQGSTPSKYTVLIKKMVISNIDVDVAYRSTKKVTHLPTIDRIELTNITSEGGFPMDQIMSSVLGQMLQSVFLKANIQNMLKELLDPNGSLNSLVKPFKGLLNYAELPEEASSISERTW